MSKIRSQGNRETELRLLKIFREAGIKGWRRHQKLEGRPDFVFRADKVAVFVDGCFWHGCPRCYRAPSSNEEYWSQKRKRNKKRDKIVGKILRERGWGVVRVWEHELRNPKSVVERIERVRQPRPA